MYKKQEVLEFLNNKNVVYLVYKFILNVVVITIVNMLISKNTLLNINRL